MTFGAGRAVLLVPLLLVGAFGAGCGDSGANSSGSHEVTVVQRRSSGLPPLPAASIAGVLDTEEVIADLAGGRCPLPPPSKQVGSYLGSSLPSTPALKMIVCRYRGSDQPPAARLAGSATITDPATVASWQRRLNALPVVDPRKYHCPNDDGSAVLLGFLSNRHDAVLVHVSRQGCQFVTIGTVTRGTNESFRNDLLRLVP